MAVAVKFGKLTDEKGTVYSVQNWSVVFEPFSGQQTYTFECHREVDPNVKEIERLKAKVERLESEAQTLRDRISEAAETLNGHTD